MRASRPSPMAPSTSPQAIQSHEIGVGKVLLTVNKFFDLPRELTELDPLDTSIDIVLESRVKYYRNGARLTVIPLRKEVISFTSSNILYKQDRRTVDFDSPTTVDLSGNRSNNGSGKEANGTGNGLADSHQPSMRSTSQNNSTTSAIFQNQPALTDGGVVDGGVDLVRSGSPRSIGQPHHRTAPTRINNKILLMFPTRADLIAVVEVMIGVRERRKDSPNAVRWLTPAATFASLNIREKESELLHFKTNNGFDFEGIGQPACLDNTHFFGFAEQEVYNARIVQRFVTTRVGHLSFTLSVPHVREDLRAAKYFHENGEAFYFDAALISGTTPFPKEDPSAIYHDGGLPTTGTGYYMRNRHEAIATMALAEDVARMNASPAALERYRAALMRAAVVRVQQDCERFSRQYDPKQVNRTVQAAIAAVNDPEQVMRRLEAGESEFSIYQGLMLACDPSCYVRRIERLLAEYPPTGEDMEHIKSVSSNGLSASSECSHSRSSSVRLNPALPLASTLEQLLVEYTGNEEELIRLLSIETGPERSSATPRMRYAFFVKQHKLNDEYVRAESARMFPDMGHSTLDTDPDLYMRYLEATTGRDESIPRLYLSCKMEYTRDPRLYLLDVLKFPTKDSVFAASVAAGSSSTARPAAIGGARSYHARQAQAPTSRSGGSSSSSADYTVEQLLKMRSERIPLQLTPMERPLVPRDPNSHRTGEIDILLDKYRIEFQQIIPSVVEAVKEVLAHSERIAREQKTLDRAAMRDGSDVLFQIFNDSNNVHASGDAGSVAAPQGEFDDARFRKFLTRLCDYTYISPSSLLATTVYLDRLCRRYPNFLLTSDNIDHMFLVMVRIASKVVDLRSVNNKNFANVFNLRVNEINFLEERTLKIMDFDFFLSPEEFLVYAHKLDPVSPSIAEQQRVPKTNSSTATQRQQSQVPYRIPAIQ